MILDTLNPVTGSVWISWV